MMAKIDFEGQTVIVTGAGGGLGRAYALEIAQRGGAVVVNDLGGNVDGLNGSTTMADEVVAEITAKGGRAIANYDSVATVAGAQAIAAITLDTFGRIDALINNAGNLRNAWFEDFKEEDRAALFDVHLTGTFNVTQAVWPHMKAQGYGRVVFTSSGAGMFGNKMQSGYGAAKAGTTGLMNVLSQEGAPHGILCNALMPNSQSRMAEKMDAKEMEAMIPHVMTFGDALSPPFIAPLVVYLASSACQSTHSIYSAMGGRIARVFIGVTEGWTGPQNAPPSVEDIASHIDQIRDERRGTHIPSDLIDEARIVADQYSRNA